MSWKNILKMPRISASNPSGGLWKDLTEEQYNELDRDAKVKFHGSIASYLRGKNDKIKSKFHSKIFNRMRRDSNYTGPFDMSSSDTFKRKKTGKPKSIFPFFPKRGLKQYSKNWPKPKPKPKRWKPKWHKDQKYNTFTNWKETLQRPANYQKIFNIVNFLKTNNKHITEENIADEMGVEFLSIEDKKALEYILQEG